MAGCTPDRGQQTSTNPGVSGLEGKAVGEAQADRNMDDCRERHGRRTAELNLPFARRVGWD
jgi:hypothetical protein